MDTPTPDRRKPPSAPAPEHSSGVLWLPYDVAAIVARTTREQRVSLRLEDPATIARIADVLAAHDRTSAKLRQRAAPNV